ncbi:MULTISPECIES: hypothetical protein [Anaeromyxobacter]|uniref:hypothetical protein n=1 Tax=Anaeromyxobacter TaxID=161492 RepID=UPI001F56ED1A|nr:MULTISPECIES: hypothetical protein [unclassified Anaeromyxobacter]
MNDQRTIYCGKRHRRADGVPVGHSCRILAPEYLRAERLEEYGWAAALLERMPIVLHAGAADLGQGRGGAPEHPRTAALRPLDGSSGPGAGRCSQ